MSKDLEAIARILNNKSGYAWEAFPSTTAGTANANSSSHLVKSELMNFGNMNAQITWTGFNTADAVVKLQMSNDGTNWIDITDGSYTIAAASGTTALVLTYLASSFVRVNFAKGTNSAGTFQVIISFK